MQRTEGIRTRRPYVRGAGTRQEDREPSFPAKTPIASARTTGLAVIFRSAPQNVVGVMEHRNYRTWWLDTRSITVEGRLACRIQGASLCEPRPGAVHGIPPPVRSLGGGEEADGFGDVGTGERADRRRMALSLATRNFAAAAAATASLFATTAMRNLAGRWPLHAGPVVSAPRSKIRLLEPGTSLKALEIQYWTKLFDGSLKMS